MTLKPPAILDEFASTLVRARSALSITQNELHKRTGISREAIKGYESGRNKPGVRELKALCEALQISPNQLIFGTEEPFKMKGDVHGMLTETGSFNWLKLAALFDLLTAKEKESFLFLLQSILLARHSKEEVEKKIGSMEVVAGMFGALMGGAAHVKSGGDPEKLPEVATKYFEEYMLSRFGPPPGEKK